MVAKTPEPVTGKRKRGQADTATPSDSDINIHITIGTYERALHGFCASPGHITDGESGTTFSDLFLVNAHASSIRCLALSPPSNHKRILATGSSDERINLYQLSTAAPTQQAKVNGARNTLLNGIAPLTTPSLAGTTAQRNRELGSLMHHSSTITTLSFPSYSKLLTASLDNTLTVLRSRDWTHLATMRAPAPKPRGRPDGDTAGPGDTPAGIAAVAVHPSQRLALSVGLGERCMRLWNLVGGSKAGVLVFDKALLSRVGEPRAAVRAGEARCIVWRPDGLEFAVAFEKGVAIFGVDCQSRAVIPLGAREKVGQIRYVPGADEALNVLAISTEAGDLLFFELATRATAEDGEEEVATPRLAGKIANPTSSGPRSRIKDFQILPHADEDPADAPRRFFVVTGSSDGAVRLWDLDLAGVASRAATTGDANGVTKKKKKETKGAQANRGGDVSSSLRGVYETGRRITCLEAFVMEPPAADDAVPVSGADDEVGTVPGFSPDSVEDSGDGGDDNDDESGDSGNVQLEGEEDDFEEFEEE